MERERDEPNVFGAFPVESSFGTRCRSAADPTTSRDMTNTTTTIVTTSTLPGNLAPIGAIAWPSCASYVWGIITWLHIMPMPETDRE